MPVFDYRGRLCHDGGVVASPGMYLIGMLVLRFLRSSFIDGAGNDARYLSAHLASYLRG
jgi:putative flavoprotein involved in K+ transport